MMTNQYQLCNDSLNSLQDDIHRANFLASSIPRFKGGTCLQMKLVYNHFAPVILYLLQWMDCSCTCLLPSYLNLFHIVVYKVNPDNKQMIPAYGRKATIREFYAVILPYLQRLHSNSSESEYNQDKVQALKMIVGKKVMVEEKRQSDADPEREDECGICLEPCTRMVLPNCCHAMCINCYRDWNMRSESCPFCRGSLKKVNSGDLWVLTCNEDIVEPEALMKEDMLRFHLYINSLPKDLPDALFLVYYEYLL